VEKAKGRFKIWKAENLKFGKDVGISECQRVSDSEFEDVSVFSI